MKSTYVGVTTATQSFLHIIRGYVFFLRTITAIIMNALLFDLSPNEAFEITIPAVFKLKA